MTEGASGAAERKRHWVMDALMGGGLALGLITAADAALPHDIPRPAPHPLAQAAPVVPQAPAVAEPPTLIAFQEPAPGYSVGSPFGLRQLPWEEHARLHAGIDIEAPAGTPIVAAADGVVTRVGVDPGYGRFVELKHAAGLSTRYGHLGAVEPGVQPGTALKAGWPVGKTGSTGTSTGAHLHFEIRDSRDRPLNPELFLGRRFATERELPFRQALRTPRTVRVAFVSAIPASKKAAMQAKLAEEAAADAAEVADATDAEGTAAARSADTAGVDAAATTGRRGHGRHHGRARMRYAVAG